jgi:hypothetical protein
VIIFEVGGLKFYGRPGGGHHRIFTIRRNQPRFLADRNEAEDALDLEVIAPLMDLVVQQIMSRADH